MRFGAFRKNRSAEAVATDKPIIHQSVPDEVLFPEGKAEVSADVSWFDTVPVGEAAKPEPAKEIFVSSQATKPSRIPSAKPKAAKAMAATPVPNAAEKAPNGRSDDARPSHPVGWLVVVEGPGVGQWFVLERGTSHVGQAKDQTVCLDFGDNTVSETRHAAITYDEKQHGFVLDGSADDALRLNGVLTTSRATLRDGDVFTVGQTSLRLVALCGPNFHWA